MHLFVKQYFSPGGTNKIETWSPNVYTYDIFYINLSHQTRVCVIKNVLPAIMFSYKSIRLVALQPACDSAKKSA